MQGLLFSFSFCSDQVSRGPASGVEVGAGDFSDLGTSDRVSA